MKKRNKIGLWIGFGILVLLIIGIGSLSMFKNNGTNPINDIPKEDLSVNTCLNILSNNEIVYSNKNYECKKASNSCSSNSYDYNCVISTANYKSICSKLKPSYAPIDTIFKGYSRSIHTDLYPTDGYICSKNNELINCDYSNNLLSVTIKLSDEDFSHCKLKF